MSEPVWPFPGSDQPPRVYDLPPPIFSVGDRVRTRWGRGTICGVCAWPIGERESRAYNVHLDGSSAPPNFGNIFAEDGIELLVEEPRVFEEDSPAWAPVYATHDQSQQELFA